MDRRDGRTGTPSFRDARTHLKRRWWLWCWRLKSIDKAVRHRRKHVWVVKGYGGGELEGDERWSTQYWKLEIRERVASLSQFIDTCHEQVNASYFMKTGEGGTSPVYDKRQTDTQTGRQTNGQKQRRKNHRYISLWKLYNLSALKTLS